MQTTNTAFAAFANTLTEGVHHLDTLGRVAVIEQALGDPDATVREVWLAEQLQRALDALADYA